MPRLFWFASRIVVPIAFNLAFFELGEVQVEVLMPTMRCSMPSRAQPGLERDKAIGTTIRDANSNNLGVYARVTRSGTVRVGDSVHSST